MIIRNHLDDPTARDRLRIAQVHKIINHEIATKLKSRGSSIAIKLNAFQEVEGGPLTKSEIDTLLGDLKEAGWVAQERFSQHDDGMIIQIRTRKIIEPSL